nr:MAG TPA: Erm Leader peptide [Caudoviricetes sp.]
MLNTVYYQKNKNIGGVIPLLYFFFMFLAIYIFDYIL